MQGATESAAAIAAPASQISDGALVQRIADRDKAALELLYLRHSERIYRFAARLTGSKSAAEETVNDVFLEVWRHAKQFKWESQVATWLLGMARFKALLRCQRRPEGPQDRNARHLIDDASGAAVFLDGERRSRDMLKKCMTTLTRIHRELIGLIFCQGNGVSLAWLKPQGCRARPPRRAGVTPELTWPTCSPQHASIARGRRSSVFVAAKWASRSPDQNRN